MTLAFRTARVASIALLATTAGVALAATARFDDLRKRAPIQGNAAAGAARAAACAACHGTQGIAVAPTFPNLAGQSQTYLYVQLRAFRDGARASAVMQPVARTLTDGDMRSLAAHFAALPAKATARAPAPAARGAALFRDGDPARGIPPCQGCHGVAGRGPHPDPASTAPQPPWSTFPALAGQTRAYVLAQLEAYHDGKRIGTSNDRVMQGVAHDLGVADMRALADYVSGL